MTEFHVDREALYQSRAQVYAREYQVNELIARGLVKYQGRLTWASSSKDRQRQDVFATALAAWTTSGRQSFFLAPGLAERLDHTDLRGAPTDALQTPYNAFWIEGCPDVVGMASHKDILGGVLVIHEPAHAPCEKGLHVCSHKRVLWIFFVYEHWLKVGDEDYTSFQVAVASDMQQGGRTYPIGKHGTWAGFKIQRLLVELDAPTIEECVERSLKAIHQKESLGAIDAWDGRPLNPDGLDDSIVRRLVSFVANFALYLSTPNPDYQRVVPPHLERHVKDLTRLNADGKKHGQTWRVGQRLTRVYAPQAGVEYDEPPDIGVGEKRRVRPHFVRGHWRNQVWGIGRALRRLLWIMPFWKGSKPDTAGVAAPGDVVKPAPRPPERIYVASFEGVREPGRGTVDSSPVVTGEATKVAAATAVHAGSSPARAPTDKKILAKQHATYAVTLRDDRDQARKKHVCRVCGDRTGFGTSHEERETLAICAKCFHELSPKQLEYELWLLRHDWS